MRKLTLEEKQNLENNRDIIGEIALELSQMNRERLKTILDVIIVRKGEWAYENGDVYDESEVMPLLKTDDKNVSIMTLSDLWDKAKEIGAEDYTVVLTYSESSFYPTLNNVTFDGYVKEIQIE